MLVNLNYREVKYFLKSLFIVISDKKINFDKKNI